MGLETHPAPTVLLKGVDNKITGVTTRAMEMSGEDGCVSLPTETGARKKGRKKRTDRIRVLPHDRVSAGSAVESRPVREHRKARPLLPATGESPVPLASRTMLSIMFQRVTGVYDLTRS